MARKRTKYILEITPVITTIDGRYIELGPSRWLIDDTYIGYTDNNLTVLSPVNPAYFAPTNDGPTARLEYKTTIRSLERPQAHGQITRCPDPTCSYCGTPDED